MGDFIGADSIRNWFSPPLSYDDVPTAEIDLKIEAVETYIREVYEITSSVDARIPALLLVVSRIVHNPIIAKNHYTLRQESIRNYSYTLDTAASPNTISVTLEDMAHRILRAKSYVKDNKLKIFISND